jgi:RimJ/RimL family protein N-acetyltransferase
VGVIRKIAAAESLQLHKHLIRLDPESRRLRFGAVVRDDFVRRFVRGLDWSSSIHLGYFDKSRLRGAAHLVWSDQPYPPGVEYAVSVEAPHQNAGIGTELTRRAVTIARNRGLRELYMVCLRENARMQHVARKVGATVVLDGVEAEGRVALPHADPVSLWQEAFDDGSGLVAGTLDQLPNPMTLLRLSDD